MPFASVRGFYDPSVNFELEFDVASAEENAGAEVTDYAAPQVSEIQVVSVEDAEAKPAGSGSVVFDR